jgi:hypothetical protein
MKDVRKEFIEYMNLTERYEEWARVYNKLDDTPEVKTEDDLLLELSLWMESETYG